MLSKAEKLIADLGPALDKIPKHQRYRYGLRLEEALWQMVRLIIEAAASGNKSKVYRLDEHLRFVHALLRHGAERRLIRPGRVGAAARDLNEIGSMVGAWRQRVK